MSDRTLVVVLAVVLLFVGGSVAVPGGLGTMDPRVDGGAEPTTVGTVSANPDAPADRAAVSVGERPETGGASLAGALGAQESHLSGTIEFRTFDERLDRADRPELRAAIVAAYSADSERRLRALRERADSLERDRANGTVAPGEYRYQRQSLASRSYVVERVLTRSIAVGIALPPVAREERGVNVSRLLVLRAEATALHGEFERADSTEIGIGASTPPAWLAGTTWNGSVVDQNATVNGTADRIVDNGTGVDAELDSLTIDGTTVTPANLSAGIILASSEFMDLSAVVAAAPPAEQQCAAAHLTDAGNALTTAQTVAAEDEASSWEALVTYTDGIAAARDCLE